MSDFIYNDNLNGGDNKEPIHFYFGSELKKSGVSKTALILICIFCVIISAGLGVLGGFLVTRSITDHHSEIITNDIKTSPYETAAKAQLLGELSRADIIELIKDTVVEVRTQYVVSQNYYTQSGAGSGVIIGSYEIKNQSTGEITERGYHIITNTHVIEEALYGNGSTITVTLTDGTNYEAQVVGSDKIGDIAILKIQETKELPCATFANQNYNLRVGEDVIAIGNPLGQLGGTVTNGFISALDREILVDGTEMNLMQIDAPINPGNSGGGLFNLRGELVGIVNAKSIGTEIEGIGFAIPANDAFKIYKDFINFGYVTERPTIYVEYSINYRGNILVSKVLTRDTGDNSDKLQVYDMIYGVRIDGVDYVITSADQLRQIVERSEIGSTLHLIVVRDNRRIDVSVTVYEYYE